MEPLSLEDYFRIELCTAHSIPLDKVPKIQRILKNNPYIMLKASEKDQYTFLRVNTILFSWALQKKNRIIRISELGNLIGDELAPAALVLIKTDLKQAGFIEEIDETDGTIVFKKEAIKAIDKIYDEAELDYMMSHPIPYCVGKIGKKTLSGFELTTLINLIGKSKDDASRLEVANELMNVLPYFFENALPGVTVEIPYADNPHIALINGPKDLWHFLFYIYPADGAVMTHDVKEWLYSTAPVERWLARDRGLHNLKLMVVSPFIARKKKDTDYFVKLEYIYQWSIGIIRFAHKLKNFVESQGNDTRREYVRQNIAESFLSMFHSYRLYETEAFAELQARAYPFVIPIARKKNTKSTADYQVILEKIQEGDALKLIQDTDCEYMKFETVRVDVNGKSYICKLVPVTDFKSNDQCTEPLDFENFNGKMLDSNHTQIVLQAIEKYRRI